MEEGRVERGWACQRLDDLEERVCENDDLDVDILRLECNRTVRNARPDCNDMSFAKAPEIRVARNAPLTPIMVS